MKTHQQYKTSEIGKNHKTELTEAYAEDYYENTTQSCILLHNFFFTIQYTKPESVISGTLCALSHIKECFPTIAMHVISKTSVNNVFSRALGID